MLPHIGIESLSQFMLDIAADIMVKCCITGALHRL